MSGTLKGGKKKLDAVKMIYQLRISLDDSNPEIWRRVLVPGKLSVDKFHLITQIVMGWSNSHLYEFEIQSKKYTNPDYGFDDMGSLPPPANAKKVKIADVLSKKDRFNYLYDFGDGWTHSIVVEEILEPSDLFHYPVCLDGANACPPEDCGGIHGYYHLLEDLEQKDSEEYLEAMAWIGGQFNHTSFDPNRVNRDVLWRQKWV